MKRSIAIIAFTIAAVVIIPLVAQTSNSGNTEANVCTQGQGECQDQGQGCKGQCEKNCEECPQKADGECQGCEKQCEEGQSSEDCNKKEDAACGGGQSGCGMKGQGVGAGQCGMMGQ